MLRRMKKTARASMVRMLPEFCMWLSRNPWYRELQTTPTPPRGRSPSGYDTANRW